MGTTNGAVSLVAKNATNASKSLLVDKNGALLVSDLSATGTMLNITVATLLKAGPGFVARVFVNTAGSTLGSVNDAATVAAAAPANQIAVLPNTVGAVVIEFPVTNGIVVTPGTGQALSVAFG